MRRPSHLAVAAVLLAACAEEPHAVPPKRPNTEIIVGLYERHPPDGETAVSFRGDGTLRLAKTRALLDSDPPLAVGTWTIAGDRLTITYDKGLCTERQGDQTGVYDVVISRVGIRFKKVEDSCERRSAFNEQTWWRARGQ